MSRLTALEAVVGHRSSHRLPAQARKGRARTDICYPNLAGKTPPYWRNSFVDGRVPPALARRELPSFTPKPLSPVVIEANAGNWSTNGGWYPLVSLATFGLGSFVPFTHAANRLQRPGLQAVGIGYSLVPVVAFVLLGTAPGNALVVPSIALASVFAAMIAAASHLIVLSRRPRTGRSPQMDPALARTMDPALARALGARARREQARALAFADPLIAQDLRVGRPDLNPEYDDGGLVDLNNAPAATIASVCGIGLAAATAIVELREKHGAFANVDEMLVLGNLPLSTWDRIRDRAVLLN